jgi:hypothetical protein
MASYNQLAQLQSADTQNQLAQMQMQEARQLAPLRMQEQQFRAASTKLTYDQAVEAQTFIKGVMSKAAEHPEAPQDPSEAAMQMLQHPNPQVQAVGGHLLDASQKLMAFRQQAQFIKDESSAPVAPTLAGAPVVTAPSIGSVTAPMVVPGTPAPNVASALSRFVAGTKNLPDGSSVGPYFSIAGQPVSEEEYTRQREAIMLPQSVNALAPDVAAAPAVNAMIPAVASALQNADALKKEIEKGDRTYGKAPGWTLKRELLVKAYEQALKPGAIGTKSEFERLLDESGLSATEKQEMRKAKLAKETAKASDRPEAKSDFEKLLAESGLTEDQKQEMRKAKLAKETAKPAEKKNEFEQLLEDSGLSETEKQDMRKAKLAKETAKPADKVEAKSDFEKLLADSGLTEEQKQAARQAKITKETAAPVSQAERKTDFEKLLEDSGLSETEKQDMRKAKLAKETTASAGSKSQFEQMLDASGLSDSKKAELRRQWLLKETRIPSSGEGGGDKMPTGSISVIDPTDPAGKRVILVTQARAIKEGLTPASSVATAKEGAATEGERKAATLLQRLQFSQSQLTDALVADPNAAKPGLFASAVAKLSTPLANTLTPEARQRVQAAQLDILDAALTLGTGAAYTREQLEGYREAYFPQIGDKPNQIKDKQARLDNVINAAKIAAGRAAQLVPAAPAPSAAGGNSAISAADAILNKGRR